MSIYSFKRDVKVYVVYQDTQYNLDIIDINFTQTIKEESRTQKTIQLQQMFESSRIYEANPAVFAFTLPAIRETDLKVVFNRVLDCYTFDLYIKTNQDTLKLANCIMTRASFEANKYKPLKFQVSGEASKLTREGDGSFVIPGTIDIRSGTKTYNRLNYVAATINTSISVERITSFSAEILNEIKWDDDTIIEGCSDNKVFTYPETFTIDRKKVIGSFSSYEVSDLEYFNQAYLQLQIGELSGATFYGFQFNLPTVLITGRLVTGEIFTHAYDWRLTDFAGDLNEIIYYVTYPEGAEGAILDYLGDPILDSWNDPILESI